MNKLALLAALLLASIAVSADKADSDHMSFGVSACGQEIVWVFTLDDGHIRRYDKDHGPKTPAARAAFRQWLEDGPTDVVDLECKPT